MTEKVTQKQLIESLQQLKDIKPRQEWASLLKSQILEGKPATVKFQKARFAGFSNAFSSMFLQRKLAYSFAAFLFVIAGIFSFARYAVPGDVLFPVKKVTDQSVAVLSGQNSLNQNITNLTSRVNDLAQITKQGRTSSIPSAVSEVNANASQLAKSLKNNEIKDLNTIKEIASSLKTLASVKGSDFTGSQDIKDLSQVIVQNEIKDLQKATLTDEQKKSLAEVQDLYTQGKYSEALEKVLTIAK